jgi:hypothetical protein
MLNKYLGRLRKNLNYVRYNQHRAENSLFLTKLGTPEHETKFTKFRNSSC